MIFITSIHYFIVSLCIICQLLLIFCVYPSFSSRLDKDLRILSRLLPGYYSNQHQYISDVTNKIPSRKRHLSLQTVIRPVNIPFLENAFNVYIEQYLNNRRNKPFKQWLYSFHVDHRGHAIRMKNFHFRDPSKLKQMHKNLEYIEELTINDIYSRNHCDMKWRRLKKKYFHGATGRDCIASVNGEQVRVEMSASLDTKSLAWQEGWYKVSDGSKSVATEGPYVMKKTQKIRLTQYTPPSNGQNNNVLPSENLAKSSKNVGVRPLEGRSLRNQIPISDGIASNHHAGIWNLNSFEEITGKLISGRVVYMIVDATKCSKSGHPVPNRFHFGMEIDNFEVSLDKRKFHGEVLQVSSVKKILFENDIYQILREVKVYRDGTIVIDFYIIDSFSNHVKQQSMAVCRIYNSQTKNGHVKFTSDPFKYVKTVKSFGSLRSALRKGRETRVVIDVNKCSHIPDKTTIIGGKLKDYDFLDSGYKIAATYTTFNSNTETENIITSQNAFAVFSSDNRMTVTLKSRNISKNYSEFHLTKTLKYRCVIGKDGRKNGLYIFYS